MTHVIESPEVKNEKRSDIWKVNPNVIVVDESFNERIDYGTNEELEELMNSIIENGVKVPLQGHRTKGENGEFEYFLTDGFRRMRAVKMALERGHEIQYVPFMLQDKNYSTEQRYFDMLILNTGKPLNMLEQSNVFRKLVDYGYEQSEIAKKIGKTVAYVSSLLTLSNAPKLVKNAIIANKISASSVLEIIRSEKNSEAQTLAVQIAIESAEKEGKSKATGKHLSKNELTNKSKEKSKKLNEGLKLLQTLKKKYSIEDVDLDELTNFLKKHVK